MPELTTVALVRDYLDDQTADSAQLTAAIDAAEDAMARYCNRFDEGGDHWLSAARTEYIDGENSRQVILTFTPITAVATVTILTSATGGTTVALTDLDCDGLPISGLAAGTPGTRGRLRMRQAFGSPRSANSYASGLDLIGGLGFGPGSVKVAYTGGYAAAPAALAQAAMVYAAQLYRDMARDASIKSESLGDYSVTFADAAAAVGIPPSVAALIGPYRRGVI